MTDKQEAKKRKIIIHVDMDAFYAAVEMRDDPSLKGKPLIIGSLPTERGVVATCNYEARKYGVHSAMNIKDAYRLCPQGIYMHPHFDKYREVSQQIRGIWNDYAVKMETVALDEAYLDVTYSAGDIETAREMAKTIKLRVRKETGLSCSVGLAYSKTAAKTASEEKKPDGYFEILTADDFVDLMIDREVRALYTVGEKTAEKLNKIGIYTVRDIQERKDDVINHFGKHGRLITDLAFGIDDREVTTYKPEDAKSISREVTFQENVDDYELLKDTLVLIAISVERRAKRAGLRGSGVTLKLTYTDMKSITRSGIAISAEKAGTIYRETAAMLDQLEKRPVRLVGAGIYNLTPDAGRQMTLDDFLDDNDVEREQIIETRLREMGEKYGLDFAGHLEDIFEGTTMYRTIEYMRKHGPRRQGTGAQDQREN